MSEVAGTIVAYDPADALGWIELGGGERIRFGLTALHAFHGLPRIGTSVRVLGIAAGFRGVRKATRVVPADYVEPPPLDPAAILRAMRLDAALSREDWARDARGTGRRVPGHRRPGAHRSRSLLRDRGRRAQRWCARTAGALAR